MCSKKIPPLCYKLCQFRKLLEICSLTYGGVTLTLLVPHGEEEELLHASGLLWCGNNLPSLGNQEISPDKTLRLSSLVRAWC